MSYVSLLGVFVIKSHACQHKEIVSSVDYQFKDNWIFSTIILSLSLSLPLAVDFFFFFYLDTGTGVT